MERVERSQMELAESVLGQAGAGVIAAQKAGEFILRYNRRQVYSDTVVSQEALEKIPRFIIPIKIPPRDQLPNNPQPETIDV